MPRAVDGRTLVMRRNSSSDVLDALVHIRRYATSDARVVDALVHASLRVAGAADEAGAPAYADAATNAAVRIAWHALRSDGLDEEEHHVAALLDESPRTALRTG